MSTLTATRSELLARRSAIRFAHQGRDLIWDKRTALMREFQEIELDLLAELGRLASIAAAAREALDRSIDVDGAAEVASAALAAGTGIDVDLSTRLVAGVAVVEVEHSPVERTPETRGWAPVLVPGPVDDAAVAHERYLARLLQVSVLELTVRRLAHEIGRATRQVNALENVVIPTLETEAREIAVALDEREREDHARLKRARDRRRSVPDRAEVRP